MSQTSATAERDEQLNADFSKGAFADTAAMDWQASPASGVWRKRLELSGGVESGRVTSVVRYDAGSAFAEHGHPGGEEILVLEGVFSDEHGDFPAGTYLLNPDGFRHAPFSKDGCVIFVKLRQYPGAGRDQITLDTNAMEWQPSRYDGLMQKTLYEHPDYPETMRLFKAAPGCQVPMHGHPAGEEVFVLEGALTDENYGCAAGAWVRNPVGSAHSVISEPGALAYVKTGGFPGA